MPKARLQQRRVLLPYGLRELERRREPQIRAAVQARVDGRAQRLQALIQLVAGN